MLKPVAKDKKLSLISIEPKIIIKEIIMIWTDIHDYKELIYPEDTGEILKLISLIFS